MYTISGEVSSTVMFEGMEGALRLLEDAPGWQEGQTRAQLWAQESRSQNCAQEGAVGIEAGCYRTTTTPCLLGLTGLTISSECKRVAQ